MVHGELRGNSPSTLQEGFASCRRFSILRESKQGIVAVGISGGVDSSIAALLLQHQFDLPTDVRSRIQKISTFRNLSQKMGVMLAARKYDFEADLPFHLCDILDL